MYSLSRRAIHPKLSLPPLNHILGLKLRLREPKGSGSLLGRSSKPETCRAAFEGQALVKIVWGGRMMKRRICKKRILIKWKPGSSIPLLLQQSNFNLLFQSKLEHDHSFVQNFDSRYTWEIYIRFQWRSSVSSTEEIDLWTASLWGRS